MAWLVGSSYHITHAGDAFTLTPTRGIRQGCVLSPLIWTCVTGTMVRDLVSRGVSIADLDLYADDFLHLETLHDYEAFEHALKRMGVIIQYLQDQGLQVSMDKTVVLMRIAGTRSSMAMAKNTYKRKDREGNEQLYIKIPTEHATLHLPVVKEHKYMGIKATYYGFEDCTLMHRISAAKNAYTRLKPFLRSRKRLSLPGRLRMWWTCVWSALRYALSSVGVTASGATTLRGLIATHMRALAVSPRHITGETTETLFARLGVDDPVHMLKAIARTQYTRLQQLYGQVDQGAVTKDMVAQAEWSLEQWDQHAGSDSRSHMRLQRLSGVGEGVPCPHCGLYFISELAVTTHIGHQHADLHRQVREEVSEMKASDMGVDGMPTCRFCLKKFHGWQTLKRHVTLGRCPAMHSRSAVGASVVAVADTVEVAQPLLQQHVLLQRLVDQQLKHELIAAEVRPQILQNCGLCGQWIADTRQVKQHIRQSHRDIWNQFHAEIDDLCAAFGRSITEMDFFRHLLPNKGSGDTQQMETGEPVGTDGVPKRTTPSAQRPQRPTKWQKQGAGKGQGQGRGNGRQRGRKAQTSAPSSEHSTEDPEEDYPPHVMELLRATARLALRLEDQQCLDRLDKAFLIHMRTQVPECMLADMFRISEKWKEARDAVPPKVESSLRVILFKSFMEEFMSRLQKIDHAEVMQGLIAQGWLYQEGTEHKWKYLMWDATQQKDVPHPTLDPIPHAQIVQAVQTLLDHASDLTLHRYHATRPLVETFKGPSVCFMLEVSLRGAHAQKMYQALSSMAQCAAMKLMGANLVRERIKRSPLAVLIQKLLQQ
ncbi:unnamed protein product [Symbiodinium sp. CCMP2592]|nr:unnamed protein product [Symbiodinium sp. CCMP2592]